MKIALLTVQLSVNHSIVLLKCCLFNKDKKKQSEINNILDTCSYAPIRHKRHLCCVLGGIRAPPPPLFFNFHSSFKKEKGKGNFSLESGGILPKIGINLPRTYEKLHCKGEPLWYSGGQQNPSIYIDRETNSLLFFYRILHDISKFLKINGNTTSVQEFI